MSPFLTPMTADPEPLSPHEILNARLQGMPQRYAARSPRARGPLPGRGPDKPRRLIYVLFGLVCGAMMAVAALSGLSRLDLQGSPSQILSALAARVRERFPAPSPSSAGPVSERSAAAPSAAGPLAARRADFNRRLSALAARGAPVWDAADFTAARRQAAETSGAEQAGGAAVARQHWQQAQALLAAIERKEPQALAAALRSGQSALAVGRQRSAARAFAFALRIDPGNSQALAGQRQARLLKAALPLLSAAHRAERAHDYAGAARYFRLALARDPHYAPARAELARVNYAARAAFEDAGYIRAVRAGLLAFGDGRLYEAQAEFQQALVFRPNGRRAALELGQVNAALRQRYGRP